MNARTHRYVRSLMGVALCLGFAAIALADEAEPEATADGVAEEAAAPEGASPEQAAEGAAEPSEEDRFKQQAAEFEASLTWQQGDVSVGDDLATLALGEDLRFVGPEDAGRLLQAWGNPPGEPPLGMIFPASLSPFADEAWGVVVTYEEEGHVDDEDAADIDYAELLEEMQSDTKERNKERAEAGFGTVDLIGWAEPPHYDASSKKLYWAKDLDFGEGEHTLNYAVRILGRKGVLELNAVASMSQLPMIRGEMTKVMERVDFQTGNRYADFDPDLDEVAAYGIGALIAGKAAAKVGLFKGLIALLVASKKLLIMGGIAVIAAIKGLFSRRGGGDGETA